MIKYDWIIERILSEMFLIGVQSLITHPREARGRFAAFAGWGTRCEGFFHKPQVVGYPATAQLRDIGDVKTAAVLTYREPGLIMAVFAWR